MNGTSAAQRLCPHCGAQDAVQSSSPVWPLGWRCPSCGTSVTEADGISLFAPALADTVSGFDPASFAKLVAIEDWHFWFFARNELIVGLANRFFPDAKSYLEIGCGTGAVLRAVAVSRPWQRLAGSDLHPAGLKFARERLPLQTELVQMDARAIPACNAFDLVGAYDIIEHVAEDEEVLRSLRGSIADGGGAIITVPQHPILWSRIDEIAHHQRRYQIGEMEAKLKRNGFDILFSSSFTAVLLPLMALSRLKGRGATQDTDIERETVLGPKTNAVLKAILHAEVRLTLAGWRWPIGGSRVVVARAF
jgi:SAM-dependent methyltransferase